MPVLDKGDIIVVIPGITGSALERRQPDGAYRATWGYKRFLTGLGVPPRLSRLVDRLTDDLMLDPRAFDDPERGFDDGTREAGLMQTQGVVPGFWTIQGYDRLLRDLRTGLNVSADEVRSFGYDWRQSNRVSAHKLKAAIEPVIEDRRKTHRGASIHFICHSMGGLVASYYAEVLDTREFTKRVITIGTPYRGAVKALAALANGEGTMAGRPVEIGDLVRSWPSVAELLPTYPCFGDAENDVVRLTPDLEIGRMRTEVLNHGLGFHQEIVDAVKARPRPLLYRAIFGYHQETPVWASVTGEGDGQMVETHQSSDPLHQGDGTVPRKASWPPEWGTGTLGVSPSVEKHSGLQQSDEVIRQLIMLASSDEELVEMSTDDELVVNVPSMVEPGQPLEVEAVLPSGSDRLALNVDLFLDHADGNPDEPPADPEPVATVPLRHDRQQRGRYTAAVPVPEAGAYRWQVSAAPRAVPRVQVVSDVALCIDD